VIGLDTNVLARYIAQDDPKQSPKANRLVESLTPEEPGFVSTVALIELVWVLSSCYELDRRQIVETLELLLRTRAIVIENAEVVVRALRNFKQGNADFADCLVERAGHAAGCSRTVTFDQGAVKHAGMTLIG
jgi:predicted nucleic-acid-binding protein